MTAGGAAAYAVDKPPIKIGRRTERVGVNETSQTAEDLVSVRHLQSLRRSCMASTCRNRTLPNVIRPSSRCRNIGKLGLDCIGEGIGRAGGISDILM